jgi:hypothetical protein
MGRPVCSSRDTLTYNQSNIYTRSYVKFDIHRVRQTLVTGGRFYFDFKVGAH